MKECVCPDCRQLIEPEIYREGTYFGTDGTVANGTVRLICPICGWSTNYYPKVNDAFGAIWKAIEDDDGEGYYGEQL